MGSQNGVPLKNGTGAIAYKTHANSVLEILHRRLQSGQTARKGIVRKELRYQIVTATFSGLCF